MPRRFQAISGWSYIFEPQGAEVFNSMLVRGDGQIERVYCDLMTRTAEPGRGMRGVQLNTLVAFVLSVATAVEVFRSRTGTSEVPYQLEFDLIANPWKSLDTSDSGFTRDLFGFEMRRTSFPRLLLGRRETLNAVSDALQVDILNATKQHARVYYRFDTDASLRLYDR
jgi:hypothetical protein